MQRLIALVGLIGLMVVTLVSPGQSAWAGSRTLYVGTCAGTSSQQYATIQAAVDAVVVDGSTIAICPGTYHEQVTIENKRDLAIRSYKVSGLPLPTIDAGGMTNSDGTGTEAIALTQSAKVTIRDVHLTNAFIGITIFDSPETKVQNCFLDTMSAGMSIGGSSVDSTVRDNTISDVSDYGLYIYVGQTEIRNNSITHSGGDGIYLVDADKQKVIDNTITNSRRNGITLVESRESLVSNNRVSNSGGTGILAEQVINSTMRGNTANFNADNGMVITNFSTGNTISDSIARGNGANGIAVASDATSNTLNRNVFRGNARYDAEDSSTGSGTAGTANAWTGNRCDVSSPVGLCTP
jgi:parallel beta-helix repeat protein